MTETAASQLTVAQELGVAEADKLSVEDLVQAIEARLGQNNMHEQARWYLLSVLRHGRKQEWQSLEESGLTRPQQDRLIELFIASDAAKQALRSVLKDVHCRFTWLYFAKARRVEQRVLSTTTKAYKAALELLRDEELLTKPRNTRRSQVPRLKSAQADGDNRRAARRQLNKPASPKQSSTEDSEISLLLKSAEPEMGDEEFARFEAALGSMPPPPPNYVEASTVDRQSLLLGLGAGMVLFALIFLFY